MASSEKRTKKERDPNFFLTQRKRGRRVDGLTKSNSQKKKRDPVSLPKEKKGKGEHGVLGKKKSATPISPTNRKRKRKGVSHASLQLSEAATIVPLKKKKKRK